MTRSVDPPLRSAVICEQFFGSIAGDKFAAIQIVFRKPFRAVKIKRVNFSDARDKIQLRQGELSSKLVLVI